MNFLALQPIFMKYFLCFLFFDPTFLTFSFKKKILNLSKFHLFLLLILSLYDSIFAGHYRFLDNDNIIFVFCNNFTIFCYSLENNWKKLSNSLFIVVAKTCIIASKPINIFVLWSQLSFLAFIESSRLTIKRKNKQNLDKNWTKIENLFLKLKVTHIGPNRWSTVSIS